MLSPAGDQLRYRTRDFVRTFLPEIRWLGPAVALLLHNFQGRIQEFWKRGPGKGRSPEQSAEGASAGGGSGGLPQKILKN